MQKGFTVIEIIIVIAIIAILSTIIAASLLTYITKSRDASIIAEMNEQAKIAADYALDTSKGDGAFSNGTDSGVCDVIFGGSIESKILELNGNTGINKLGYCLCDQGLINTCKNAVSPATKWCLCNALASDKQIYCIDYLGNKKQYTITGNYGPVTCFNKCRNALNPFVCP